MRESDLEDPYPDQTLGGWEIDDVAYWKPGVVRIEATRVGQPRSEHRIVFVKASIADD